MQTPQTPTQAIEARVNIIPSTDPRHRSTAAAQLRSIILLIAEASR